MHLSTHGYITTFRTRCIRGPEGPLEWIGAASEGGRSSRALVGNFWSTELSLMTPIVVAGSVLARIRVEGNLERLAGTQIALCVARARDPGGCAASTVGTAIVEETGEGGNVGVAVGIETLMKGARGDATEAQHWNVIAFDRIFHVCSVAIVVAIDVDVAAQDEERRHDNCEGECEGNRENATSLQIVSTRSKGRGTETRNRMGR
jgi:hypothetical protein